ncbi:cell wall hydrolase [Azospirillum rugosum]|uniref:Cell wall hydrolase SleB domain-containing protein n=1 Tax=Azospirillum rugosum TaxID=416170 RepID=A0ABS4SMI5_9PROT|nr:cell wall hydrolase [Azospirillum rugosum]MBP2293775.1 hypothetical protein [Azospirillum rugosum]MDQ0527320.1 hypothetical protein [Azospirillum rugosum]
MRRGSWIGIAWLALLAAPGTASADPFQGVDCAARRQDELTCLACNIYHESRDQPEQGQLAVAMVTLNRLRTADFPKSICEVVWEKGRDYRTGRTVAQFSWTLDDRSDRVTEPAAWDKAKSLAARAMATLAPAPVASMPDPSLGALYFHADSVTPDWSGDAGLRLVTRIGNHLFYARTKDAPGLTLVSGRSGKVAVGEPLRMAGPVDRDGVHDADLAGHPALGAVRRGAKLISLSRDGGGAMAEAKVYQGSRSWVVRVRREGL